MDAENLAPTAVRTVNHATRSESLYRLRYRSTHSDPKTTTTTITIITIIITQFKYTIFHSYLRRVHLFKYV